ncbi:MAG: class II aldolase/adducin family protein [Anaerovoracaceae bacterium]|jgi:ribulose-5-phosphate 4-epimerase/fuculose-1-phosphate aldolase
MTYTREEAAPRLLDAVAELADSGLIARTWGNLSMRLDGGSFLITPSGRAYETLSGKDLVVVHLDGSLTAEGIWPPSSEKGLHAALYRLHPEVQCIVHTHQRNASAIGVGGRSAVFAAGGTASPTAAAPAGPAGQTLPPVAVSAEERQALGPDAPCADYGMSATPELAAAAAAASAAHPQSRAILLPHHGAVCLGADAAQAFRTAYTLEQVCGRLYETLCGTAPEEPQAHDIRAVPAALQSRLPDGGCWLQACTPAVLACSRRGREVPAYLDDLAMIGGISTLCVEGPSRTALARALSEDRDAVLLRDAGALCRGAVRAEAEALCTVLEKNCCAALLAESRGWDPLPPETARRERRFYVDSYAGRKEQREGAAPNASQEKNAGQKQRSAGQAQTE